MDQRFLSVITKMNTKNGSVVEYDLKPTTTNLTKSDRRVEITYT